MYDEDNRGGVRINWTLAIVVSLVVHGAFLAIFLSLGKSSSPAAPDRQPVQPAPADTQAAPAAPETQAPPAAPAPTVQPAPSAPAGNTQTTVAGREAGNERPNIYIVQAGDSLTRIANRYDLTVAELAKANGLAVTAGLRIGQRLKLPR